MDDFIAWVHRELPGLVGAREYVMESERDRRYAIIVAVPHKGDITAVKDCVEKTVKHTLQAIGDGPTPSLRFSAWPLHGQDLDGQAIHPPLEFASQVRVDMVLLPAS